MMKKIGFCGGGSIYGISLQEDILAFFGLVNKFVVKKHPKTDWSLITDRFYKRYLKWEELEPATKLMEQIQEIFAKVPTTMIIWHNFGIDEKY